jgi:hypothetical protein
MSDDRPQRPRTLPRITRSRVLMATFVMGIAIGGLLQLFPAEGIGENPSERFVVDAPPEVAAILKRSCFDCHSNETHWPWYARIAPGSWLMARDVRKGRARFNVSEWGGLTEEERALDKEISWDQIKEGKMPPWFYLPLHPSARLSERDKQLLGAWLVPDPAKR